MTEQRNGRPLLAVGCYTAEGNGRGRGITTYWRDPATGALDRAGELAVPAPSFLARHPRLPVLYAVNEYAEGEGAVTAVAVDASSGGLRRLGSLPSGGSAPCHLAVAGDGRHLLVANYGGGSAAVFALDGEGRLVERTDLVRDEGRGPNAERQDGPHVHMVVPGPDRLWSTVDLGTDEIRSYRLSEDGRLVPVATSALPPGYGPRQLVRIGGQAYCVAELGSVLSAARESSPGGFELLGSAPASAALGEPDNLPAHLTAHQESGLLFLSNRGADTVAVFRTVAGAAPEFLAEYPCGGRRPRHIELLDGHLYICDQESDTLDVHAVDGGTGALRPVHSYPTGSPTCAIAL